MAEGFGRFYADDHARFLIIGRSLLMETHNSAGAGLGFGYFSAEDTNLAARGTIGQSGH
jgi:hypothetical protein